MKKIRHLILLLVTLLLGFSAAFEPARAQNGLIVRTTPGLDGYCKTDTWLPVRVTIENSGANLEGRLSVRTNEGQRDWDFYLDTSIPAVSRKEFTVYVFPQGREDELVVNFSAGGDTLYQDTLPINCVPKDDLLLGVWAQTPSVFNAQTTINPGSGRATLLVLDSQSIPDRPQGLAMLDALTLSNVDTGTLSQSQHAAIATWVANGGRLLITGGPNWLKTAGGWNDLLPINPSGSVGLQDFSSLGAAFSISPPPAGEGVIATGTIRPGAAVRAAQGDQPLIVEHGYGFGTVIYFTFDPAYEPLRTWDGAGDFYQTLLGTRPDVPAWKYGFTQWFEANEALNVIAGLELPPFWLICSGILLYILFVGPINFIVLRKLNRREAAWYSIPLIVLASTVILVAVSISLLGNRPIINRLAVVEIWPEESSALVHGLIGVFSPTRDTFQLEMDGDFIAHPLPLQGFGQDLRSRAIQQTDAGFAIPDLRVDIGDLEGVAISGEVPAPRISSDLAFEIRGGATRVLMGSIRNDSGLLLEDAHLLTSASSRALGDIGPGQQVAINAIQTGGSSSPLNTPFFPGPVLNSDNTLYELFGTYYLSPSMSTDTEVYRRFMLMTAALGGGYGSRGGRTYLVAWSSQVPFETRLSGTPEQYSDTSLYIFHLDPATTYAADNDLSISLPPSAFSWAPFGEAYGNVSITPYSGYLENNSEYALEFVPLEDFTFSSIENLTLHLESYGQVGSVPFDVALWDFTSESWRSLTNATWGDTQLQSPQRFVGSHGEIRLQLRSAAAFGQQIERSDFTLTVRR